ncbi:MAG: AAA family ATPase [Acidobacteria bacterium]|nr:AAA family ATPase [Acidobacteriota bacterium]
MIGRKSELKRLADALQTTFEDRELQVVTIVGDAGLGKSRLLYEFINKIELLPELVYVFNGRASEAMQGLPYALVRDVFSFRFEIQDSDPPPLAREKLERGLSALAENDEPSMSGNAGTSLRGDAPDERDEAAMRAHFIGQLIGFDFSESRHLSGILDDAKQIRDRAFHYAARFFASVGRKSPVVLLLDDIHWADEGSLDFVRHLARNCETVPLLILCLARPSLLERRPSWGEGEASHTRLTLQPLSKRESRQLVEEILRQARSVPQELGELVVGGAEGNPFYVEELIKMLIDQRVIMLGAEEWRVDASRLGEVRVPPTLTGVLQARLDSLSPAEKTALQRASVVGRVFWDSAVERLSVDAGADFAQGRKDDSRQPRRDAGEPGVLEVLESLRRKELIYRREASSFAGTTEYSFKHALLRDVTYETVLKRERRGLHRLVAEWLMARSGERVGEYAAVIAGHYEQAAETARASEWYGRAGTLARETYAPETAIQYYRKAVALARGTPKNWCATQRTPACLPESNWRAP